MLILLLLSLLFPQHKCVHHQEQGGPQARHVIQMLPSLSLLSLFIYLLGMGDDAQELVSPLNS